MIVEQNTLFLLFRSDRAKEDRMSDSTPLNGKLKASRTTAADFQVRSKALRTKTEERLDHLTGIWREIEKKLLSLLPPHEVIHVYHRYEPMENRPAGFDHCRCIGITKYSGKWRLCFGEYDELDEANYGEARIAWTPVTDGSKADRIALAAHVKDLQKKIVETGEQMIPEIDEAIHLLEDCLIDI